MANGKAFLIGGRGLKPVDEFDPLTLTWTARRVPPLEMHHMQCVEFDGKVWVVGAEYGNYPFEDLHESIFVYDPVEDEWSTRSFLPDATSRRRGGGALVVYENLMYYIAGNIGGHGEHATALSWLDVYDPIADSWSSNYPDAPHARDHAGGGVVMRDGHAMVCIASGRDSGVANFFESPVAATDCFNVSSGAWIDLGEDANIPNPRAGAAVGTTCDGLIVVAGGEGFGQAYTDVDYFDGKTWLSDRHQNLNQARHGTGLAVGPCNCPRLYIASGGGNQGGGSDIDTTEVMKPDGQSESCVVSNVVASSSSDSSSASDESSESVSEEASASSDTSSGGPQLSGIDAKTATLYAIPAGVYSENVGSLKEIAPKGVTTICPSDFGAGGFSVVCILRTNLEIDIEETTVTMSVKDGSSRVEAKAPYSLAGDMDGNLAPWSEYTLGDVVTFQCSSAAGHKGEARALFKCS